METRTVTRPAALLAQLGEGWDAVVVDESQAGWSAEAVLDQVRARGPAIPVVVVCEPAGESAGIALLERGATDCLAADRLARLPVAVRAAGERGALARQLAAAEAASAGAREMLRVAFDNYPDAAIAVDASARVVEWNRLAERLLGWSEAEARGRRLADLVGGEEMAEPLVGAVAETASTRMTQRHIVPVKLIRRDGQPVRVRVLATHRRDLPGGVALSLSDMTDRWRSDWLKDHQLGVLRALASSGEEASLTGAMEQIALAVRGTEARLWEVDPRGAPRVRVTWAGAGPGEATASPDPTVPPAFVQRAISSGRLWFSEPGPASPIGENLAIPVTSGEQVLGVVEVSARNFTGFDDAYVAFFTSLGSYLGSFLAQRRMEGDFARSLEELHRINGERRRLMRLLVEAHEDERRAIAADIHDDPLQVMAAVSLRLHSLRRRLDDEPARNTLESVEEMVSSAVSRLRHMMFNLRPPGLDHGDLLGPLRERLEQVRHDDLIEYTLCGSEPATLATDRRVTLYRIAQEAIANIVKHAAASHIDVSVEEQDGGCLVRIADDGAGLGAAPEALPSHLGLPSMHERAQLAGGWLRVEAGETSGTVVSAWIPVLSEPRRDGGGYAR
jgi:PAS domain S-box-containing protein